MQFNQNALSKKTKHLDEIKANTKLLDEVIGRNMGIDVSVKEQTRRWVGGGATSYLLELPQKKVYLKVKHKDVTVESKLEEEKDFLHESCLSHEYKMLKTAEKAGVSVPSVVFYDTNGDFEFLATEYIKMSLEEALNDASLDQILKLWESLTKNVRTLFDSGLVHSDIHEYNIRCKSAEECVLIDFEECRCFKQNCHFEESLDFTGTNGHSSLGEFPLCHNQKYSVHINSLARMRQVFKEYVAEKTVKYIKECNYDSSNGICVTIDHGKSEKTYQPIKNSFFKIDGQRGEEDKRPRIINALCDELLNKQEYILVDIGSNNGLFCREHSKHTNGASKSIGLEGFHKFNVLAKALAFLDDCKNIEYYDFLCGEDDLKTLSLDKPCFISICSVWHHIQQKQAFLEQLKNFDIAYIFLEMAVQEECYESRSWEKEIENIKMALSLSEATLIGYSSDYNRPMVLISKKQLTNSQKTRIRSIMKSIYRKSLWERIRRFVHGK